MSATLTRTILQLNAIAAQRLGWKPNEFWQATPAELSAALVDPTHLGSPMMSLAEIEHMMERDKNG